MHQPVATGKDVHEGAELGDAHHLARVLRVDLGLGRVGDGLDPLQRLADGVGVGGTHPDRAVVLHVDLGAGLSLDVLDDLALGADDLADLVDGHLDGRDPGRRGGDLLAGRRQRLPDDFEDGEARLLRLRQGAGEDLGGEALDLGVELQGGDELARARHLEVHVTKGVLGTEDVGERLEAAVLGDEPHGDAGHRRLDGHTGVHERERRRAHRRHRRRPVRAQDLRDEAEGVGELLLVGDHGEQGPLGEGAVADLPALRGPHPPRLTDGEGGEVVVVHVALRVVHPDGVEGLGETEHAERGDVQHLGLAPLEETGTVHAGDETGLGVQGTDVRRGAAVDPEAFVEDAAADHLLLEGPEGLLDRLLLAGELLGELLEDERAQGVLGRLALLLVGGGDDLTEAVRGDRLHAGGHLLGVVGEDLVGERLDVDLLL